MALPQFQNDDKDFQMMQSTWGQQLNPVLSNPSLKNLILKDVALIAGANVINHLLGRTMQGWRICDNNAAVTPYRTAPFNAITLTLTASAPCVVTLEVF